LNHIRYGTFHEEQQYAGLGLHVNMHRKEKDGLLLLEIDVDTPPALAVGIPTTAHVHTDAGATKQKGKQRATENTALRPRDTVVSTNQSARHSQERIVVSIPDASIDKQISRLNSAERSFILTSSSDTIDSVKCVVSTVLFLAVVAGILVVAILKNPGM